MRLPYQTGYIYRDSEYFSYFFFYLKKINRKKNDDDEGEINKNTKNNNRWLKHRDGRISCRLDKQKETRENTLGIRALTGRHNTYPSRSKDSTRSSLRCGFRPDDRHLVCGHVLLLTDGADGLLLRPVLQHRPALDLLQPRVGRRELRGLRRKRHFQQRISVFLRAVLQVSDNDVFLWSGFPDFRFCFTQQLVFFIQFFFRGTLHPGHFSFIGW